ncbi:bifunctional TATA-box binding protein/TBP domain superfamily/TATA-box binding protein [Babesia duncani]|uniref:Bifunctional TATA-box binding protein/TBP domain superfamily/TATA-box binding protein n=1 Tax=Babesia duncani TaxID=323732 RepID=A0AAD9PMI0_9APIC|nr:bifunctional TATA-box binding protein/TBP domain superfamily/TATA-box binding protein [Babesia duncani]
MTKRGRDLSDLGYYTHEDGSDIDGYADSDTTRVESVKYDDECHEFSSTANSHFSGTLSTDDESELLLYDTVTPLKSKNLLTKYSTLYESVSLGHSPAIQNIVASVHLGNELDLREIAISTRNAEYNPRKFNALILRMQNPKCTGLIFRTGRVMVTGTFLLFYFTLGCRALENSYLGARRMAKMIRRELNQQVEFREFRIENIIATFNCNVPIRLEALSQDHKEMCNYEPEFFAGLVYRCPLLDESEAVLLIFVSGNVIVTGCRSQHDINYVYRTMLPVLQRYKE